VWARDGTAGESAPSTIDPKGLCTSTSTTALSAARSSLLHPTTRPRFALWACGAAGTSSGERRKERPWHNYDRPNPIGTGVAAKEDERMNGPGGDDTLKRSLAQPGYRKTDPHLIFPEHG